MKKDFDDLKKNIIGCKVQKPLSGNLSGHAAGEPFDQFVYRELKKKYPKTAFRQYEYLNFLYTKNPSITGSKERANLFDSPTVLFLLSRGKSVTDKWDLENIFEEKQNDTADILLVDNGFFDIIDVRTKNINKNSQPPNIISAYKLAQTCAKMLDNEEFDTFTIYYIGLSWEVQEEFLTCVDVYYVNLFSSNPQTLYINWAAAMQIQFHVEKLDQSFTGDKKLWAKLYLKHFVKQAKKRSDNMIEKFVKPFEKYLD